MQFCNSWEWDGNLIAIVMNNRFAGYRHANNYGLSTTDCLCYKLLPSIADIILNHKKVVEYSLFGVLRKV